MMTPKSVIAPSATVATNRATCVIRMTFRRSTRSASAPAKSPSSSEGAVLADCTSATMSADGVSVAISQATIVVCVV